MQNKFVLQDKVTKKIESDIENLFTKGYNDLCDEVVSSSDIAKCDRRIYYTLMGIDSQIDLHNRMHHSYIVKKWVDILSTVKYFQFVEKEVVVADHNYNLTSIVDIVGKIDDFKVILMVREVTKDTLSSNNAKRFDVVELLTQMWLIEVNDGLLVYEDMIDRKINIFHILPNVSVLNAVKEKMLYLVNCKLTGTMPEQKYETPDTNECKECCFADNCWR